MQPDMRKGVDEQRPGNENKQAPRVREFSESASRAVAVNQETRKGPGGSTSDNPKPSIASQ